MEKRISSTRAHRFAKAWIEAWNAHDLDQIMSHYAASLEFTSPLILKRVPGTDGTLRDRAALRDYFRQGLAAAPDLKFELRQVLRAVKGFTLYYLNARGGYTAEYIELDEDDRATYVIASYA